MKNPEYYFCYIGPADREQLDKDFPNGEGRMRSRIQKAFVEVTGHNAEICGSVWGLKKEQLDELSFSTYGEEIKLEIVKSYLYEKREMPRHIKAWHLLFKETKKL